MSRILLAVALFGVVALSTARPSDDESKAEWTGKPWLGKWVSTDRVENWQPFVDELALPEQFSDLHLVEHKFWKEGDHFHHVFSIPSKNFKKSDEFRLNGPEVEVTHTGHTIKLKYTEEGDKLVIDVNFVGKNKHVRSTYHVQGNGLLKTYKTGNVEAKRWFRRQ